MRFLLSCIIALLLAILMFINGIYFWKSGYEKGYIRGYLDAYKETYNAKNPEK